MPELPEVETIKNDLLSQVVGKSITDIALPDSKVVHILNPEEFVGRIVERNILDVRRRGKYLIFPLSGEETLIIHLRMTGVLLLIPASGEAERYTRAVLHLNDGTGLHFCDRRRLGMLRVVKNENDVTSKLGPEPLDEGFTCDRLASILMHRDTPIKALLCDQNVIAGIGNMYADETLFAARVYPLSKGTELSSDDVFRLHGTIQEVLRAAIRDSGASVDTYKRPDGMHGTAHHSFRVAHRGGRPCTVCGTAIQRMVVRGRGTYYCPNCQCASVTSPVNDQNYEVLEN